MGLTKTDIFSTEQNQLAVLLKALAHPARIAILQQIINANACICGDLSTELGLAQPTISQHLKELKNAELIKGAIEGASVCYCIDQVKWGELKKQLDSLLNSAALNNSCC